MLSPGHYQRSNRNPLRCRLSQNSKDPIGTHLAHSLKILERAIQDADLLATAKKIAEVIIGSLRAGNKLLVIGNGGSAASMFGERPEVDSASNTSPRWPRPATCRANTCSKP